MKMLANNVSRASTDDSALLWEHAIFAHWPNKYLSTDGYKIRIFDYVGEIAKCARNG
jgi:hypothetical protein